MSGLTVRKKAEDLRTSVPIRTGAALGDLAREVTESVGRRAYEFYEARGRQDGQDLADWLRAESELTGIDARMSESNGEIDIEIPLGDLAGTGLQVGVDYSHVVVTARSAPTLKRTEATPAGSIRAATSIDLPAEVDPARAAASTDGQTLTIVLPKISAS